MSRRPGCLVSSLLIAALPLALASVAACSGAEITGADGNAVPPSAVADQDAGDVTDDDAMPPGTPGKDGGASPGDGGDPAADASVPPLFASDPLSCGAAGHSCLGAPCSNGQCKPEEVPTAGYSLNDYTFDDDGSLIIIRNVKKGAVYVHEVRRVAAGGASAPLVFTRDQYVLGNVMFTQGAMFGEGSGITRYDGSGGSEAVKTVLAPNGRNLAFGGPELYFEDNGGLVRLDAATNAITQLPRIPNSGSKLAIYPLGPDIYTVNTRNDFLRIPKDGTSPHAVVPVTGLSTDYVFNLFATPTTLGGLARKLGGSCATTTYTLWSAPIAGGAAKVLASFTGPVSVPLVSGEYVYWGENGCNTSTTPTRIMRRRADGSDAPLVLFSAKLMREVKLFGAHLYWTDGSLHRVPK